MLYQTEAKLGIAEIYVCNICKKIYDYRAYAETCAARGYIAPIFNAGDLVTTDSYDFGRFGWFDGDENWVIKKKSRPSRSNRKEDFSLIYVITAITYQPDEIEGHEPRYHLTTKAMRESYVGGWTNVRNHLGLALLPEEIKERHLVCDDLIGKVYGRGDLV